ncbi:MAG TPA: hypothetical protein PK413_07065 [Thermoanaerobaculia bacterium]|nr:hypothetical protein [Thermoanaerobaculia bacterium]
MTTWLQPHRWMFCLLAGSIALTAAAGDQAQNSAQRAEAAFLAKAGPEWTSAGPGTWERREPNGAVFHHGFGRESAALFLEELRARQAEIVASASPESLPAGTAKTLADLSHQIQQVERLLASDPRELSARAGGITGTQCVANRYLDVSYTLGSGWAAADASSSFLDFGPSHVATMTAQASACYYEREFSNYNCDSQSQTATGQWFEAYARAHAENDRGPRCSVRAYASIQVSACGYFEWTSVSSGC